MKVQIERFREPGGILRVWVQPDAKHGDPYRLSLTVRWLSDDTIELLGLFRDDDKRSDLIVTPEMWRAIREEAAALGIKRVNYTRMNTGERRERCHSTANRRK